MDGKPSSVATNSTQSEAVRRKPDGRVESINLDTGRYDVRMAQGANYASQSEKVSEGLQAALQSAPSLAPILAPLMLELQNLPNGERYVRMLMAMTPPEVQAIFNEDADTEVPPHVQAKLAEFQKQMQAMQQALQESEEEMKRLEAQVNDKDAKNDIAMYEAETKRMQALNPPEAPTMPPEVVQALAMQLAEVMLSMGDPTQEPPEPEPAMAERPDAPIAGDGGAEFGPPEGSEYPIDPQQPAR